MKMNPEIKQRWIDALRSGEYKQGMGHLKKNDTYCCLGVLCELMGVTWDYGHLNEDIPDATAVAVWGDDEGHALKNVGYGILPITLTTELGLKYPNPDVLKHGQKLTLAACNDVGMDFNEIADLIEANL